MIPLMFFGAFFFTSTGSETSIAEDSVKIESVSVDNINDSITVNQTDSVWVTVFEKTKASYYGGEKRGVNYHGRKTANGEIFDTYNGFTFARQIRLKKQFPFNSIIRVTNLVNGKQVILRCNDTGGLAPGRSIDISRVAMETLDGIYSGVINVKIERLEQ